MLLFYKINNIISISFLFKVETIGDAYMVVSGAPVKENDHADRVCDMALDMVEAITDLKDRSTGKKKRRKRLSILFLKFAFSVFTVLLKF